MPFAPTSLRPLLGLRENRDISADEIVEHNYGGVVWEVNATSIHQFEAARDLAIRLRKNELEFWLDIGRFPNTSDANLAYQYLHFENAIAHFKANDIQLDPFDARSTDCIAQWLNQFDATLLTGVLDELPWRELGGEATLFAPFPWTPPLANEFDGEKLSSLVSSIGDEAARIRQEYWDSLWRLLHQNRYDRLKSWSESKTQYVFRYFRPTWEALQLDGVLRVRMDCAFAANTSVFPSRLTAQSPTQMLRESYRLLHAGASRLVIDYAPERFTPAAKILNSAIAHALARVANTKRDVRVGVLFPARSCQTHYHPQGHRFTRWVGDDLKRTTHLLDALHFDWSFVTEDDIISSREEAATLHISSLNPNLDMIVVPGVSALGTQTWQKLEKFTEAGGKVACLGLLPRWSERGRDAAFEDKVGKAALVVADDLFQAYAAQENETPLPPTLGFPVFREQPGGGRLCSYQPYLNPDVDDARLRVHQILRESMQPDFETQSPDILYAHFAKANEDLFLVFNDGTATQRISARIRTCNSEKVVEQVCSYDAATDETGSRFVWMQHPDEQGGGVSVSLDLAPGEARFITIIGSSSSGLKAHLESASFEVQELTDTFVRGYTTQIGVQKVALREGRKLQWYYGPHPTLPIPLLLDEWELTGDQQFTHGAVIPAEWHGCEIFLEVAGAGDFCEVIVANEKVASRIAPPWRFKLTAVLRAGETNSITLSTGAQCDESTLLARLVAYPIIKIQITNVESDHE